MEKIWKWIKPIDYDSSIIFFIKVKYQNKCLINLLISFILSILRDCI